MAAMNVRGHLFQEQGRFYGNVAGAFISQVLIGCKSYLMRNRLSQPTWDANNASCSSAFLAFLRARQTKATWGCSSLGKYFSCLR